MPTLVIEQGGITCTILEKVEFLKARFYPTIKVDLLDIENLLFSRESFLQNTL